MVHSRNKAMYLEFQSMRAIRLSICNQKRNKVSYCISVFKIMSKSLERYWKNFMVLSATIYMIYWQRKVVLILLMMVELMMNLQTIMNTVNEIK